MTIKAITAAVASSVFRCDLFTGPPLTCNVADERLGNCQSRAAAVPRVHAHRTLWSDHSYLHQWLTLPSRFEAGVGALSVAAARVGRVVWSRAGVGWRCVALVWPPSRCDDSIRVGCEMQGRSVAESRVKSCEATWSGAGEADGGKPSSKKRTLRACCPNRSGAGRAVRCAGFTRIWVECLTPLAGLSREGRCIPTAHAVGYILPPYGLRKGVNSTPSVLSVP